MRKIMLLIAVLILPGALRAADPSVGTWKLNVAKSKFRLDEVASKEETMVVQETGSQLIITQKGVGVDDVPYTYKWTHSIKGGAVRSEEDAAPSPGISYFVVVFAPGDRYEVILQFGVQVELHHIKVSEDGGITTISSEGRYESGRPFERLMVYERR